MPNTTLQSRSRQNQTFLQQENSAILYSVNWAAQLDTDTISSSTWTAENSGATLSDETNTTNSTSVRVTGDPGKRLITNKIVTASGNTLERQLIIKILDNNRAFVSDYQSCG